ncbi:MAG: hypothetical protein LBR11_09915 [Deltaproteobacteria bacterium]|nr:hypothetical protein [Deltaproteobacteria bacterium]
MGFFASDNASLGVYPRPEALSAQFELEPYYLPESVIEPHATGPFMAACQTYAVTITLTPVTLAGFAFNQNGREVVTNALGQVQGTIRYSRDNLADYQANPDWSITVPA